MEFVKLKPINRICPRCGNGNYMRTITGKNVGELNVKCINCNSYYNYDELLKRDNSKPLNGADGRTMDLISRAAAIKAFTGKPPEYYHTDYIASELRCLPTVDAAPVVHGEWKWSNSGQCSECGFHNSNFDYNFCPNCGARMDG